MASLEIELLHGHINHDPHFDAIFPTFTFTCNQQTYKTGVFSGNDILFVSF